MPITTDVMQSYLAKLLGFAADSPKLSLEEYVAAVPGMEALDGLPSGTKVLIRGDVDAKPGAAVGEGDIRLRSMVATLKHGQEKGWIQIIFGHIGRKPEGSLSQVHARLQELIGGPIAFVSNWFDEATTTVTAELTEALAAAKPGDLLLLENTRKYDVERTLWKAKPADLPGVSDKLSQYANELAQKVATVYLHEAFSAGSLDSSSVVVTATMEKVAQGAYERDQFTGPLVTCRQADLVIFSGLKIDKLDDLQAIVQRGNVRKVLAAGSLAMSLKKAAARLDGGDFHLGVSEDPTHSDKPYYIEPARIDQAQGLLEHARRAGIEFIMPVDFVLGDGRTVESLQPGDQQFDVGQKSSELFAQKIDEFIQQHKQQVAEGGKPMVAFHNGVFGMFEDPRFENGTKNFVAQLKRMTEAGVQVFVGGGEGGAAVEKYGNPETDVTHVFTAGGTVLNALGSEPIPYLQSMYLQVQGV